MRDAVALRRYLQRYAEPDLPLHVFTEPCWHQLLVVPVYRESPALLHKLQQLPASDGKSDPRTLVILVLNRPDTDNQPTANAELRNAIEQGALATAVRSTVPVYCLNPHTDLYLHDMEKLYGPNATALGVGLARKSGSDLALQWMASGGISGQWLCSTDADAQLPPDYFAQLGSAAANAVAATFPFRHAPGMNDACNQATALYELRLHHYVLGLEYAKSSYAYHTLGSCLAIRASAYAHVHGFPKRAGAEDFYVLNKLAKIGSIARLRGECIQLESRDSSRVPFGTGPAVAAIMNNPQAGKTALFYDPRCFDALRRLLQCLPLLPEAKEYDLKSLLIAGGMHADLADKTQTAMQQTGIGEALKHCQRQSRSERQFLRQFHQWFDGFRTLKFVHALRDRGMPAVSLQQLDNLEPVLWPDLRPDAPQMSADIEQLQNAIHKHWGWR
jgi:hypothetical protein